MEAAHGFTEDHDDSARGVGCCHERFDQIPFVVLGTQARGDVFRRRKMTPLEH
jgi:hypothetical protein